MVPGRQLVILKKRKEKKRKEKKRKEKKEEKGGYWLGLVWFREGRHEE